MLPCGPRRSGPQGSKVEITRYFKIHLEGGRQNTIGQARAPERVHPRFPGDPGQYFSFGDLRLPVHDISIGGLGTIVSTTELADVLRRETG